MRCFPSALLILVLSYLAAPLSAGLHPRGGPSTTNNNDSCDIALLPAATLLLPYFEVDLVSQNGETALFTITNVSPAEQIAHVTLWTNRAYPVIDFNIYLTGYDVQSINLRDVLMGRLAQPRGVGLTDEGELSRTNRAVDATGCDDLPSELSPATVQRMHQAFMTGGVPATGNTPACTGVSTPRSSGLAVGYATIDVVGSCTTLMPTETAYYTDAIRYDNVLIGEYQQVNRGHNFAQGGPLVHIRAIRGSDGKTNLADTFYARFQSAAAPKLDARQPLPSTFAARWVDGGHGAFETSFKIWRQGLTGPVTPCDKYKCNAKLQVTEFARFDEEENVVGAAPEAGPVCIPIELVIATSAAFRVDAGDPELFPQFDYDDALGGWIYMNLTPENEEVARQAWVITSMRAQGRYSVDSDALALGNGCTPRAPLTEIDRYGDDVLGPAPNVTP
jgi:hypothetical protein